MKIVLIGFMGAGKTAVGERLARRLGWPLLDVDQRIEEETGQTIGEIFNTRGEEEFRRLEAAQIARSSRDGEMVLTTGGGAVLNPDSVRRLREEGIVYWLRTSPAELVQRLGGRELANRPLLTDDPSRIAELSAAREEFYRQAAHLVVDTDGRTPDEVAAAIIADLPWPREVRVELKERAYPIHIGYTLMARVGEILGKLLRPGPALLITSRPLEAMFGLQAASRLQAAGWRIKTAVLPDGEAAKSLSEVEKLYGACLEAGLGRDGLIVALGGGTVGDAAGFVAATYLRGIDYVHVSTTLVAQVDSSIGGKTGVNLPTGKNLVGSFHQPRAVVADTGALATLPERERRSGLAEVLKTGLLASPPLVDLLEDQPAEVEALKGPHIPWMVEENCRIKAAVVAEDEREGGRRAILNLGHTVGHALEAATGYSRYTHGEAVAVGLVAASQISRRLGLLSAGDGERIAEILARLGLPVRLPPLSWESLKEPLARDKKIRQGKWRFVLLSRRPNRGGDDPGFEPMLRDDVPESLVREVLVALGATPD